MMKKMFFVSFLICILFFSALVSGDPIDQDLQQEGGCGMMNPFGYGFMGLGMAGSLIWILFWTGIIILAYYLLKKSGTLFPETGKSALSIAEKRFAKGEITKKEFDEIKKTIG